MHSETQLAGAPAHLETVWARYTRLFLALAFLLAIFGVCSGAIASADTWWHLATGRWIVAHHAVPYTDPFSYAAAGKKWVAHEYLTDVLMYVSYQAGGMIALASENALLLMLAFTVIAYVAEAPRWVAFLSAVFAAFAARPAFALRPQSISLLFGAVFLWILYGSIRRHDLRWLIALPCLMLLWVQLHAGYLLGIVFVGLVLVAEILDRWTRRGESTPREWLAIAGAGVACVAVVPLNPNGFTMLTFPFFVMRMKINATIQEWRPANLHDPHLRPFVALAVVTLGAMLFSRQRYRPGRFLIYGILLAAALKSARNIPVFCLVAALLLAEHLWVPRKGWARLSPASGAAIAAVVLVLAGYFCAEAASSGLAFQALAEKNIYPEKAVAFVHDQSLPRNVLNDYTFGGYMIWRLYPEYQVYVDGRADLYGDSFLAEYVAIYNGERDPRPFLERNRINTVVLSPTAGLTTLLRMLTLEGSWKLAYEDGRAVIFIRSHSVPVQ
ncbi:MAG TPA: hypothetical protein VGL89_00360 [Candidatus Koribacter sp.]